MQHHQLCQQRPTTLLLPVVQLSCVVLGTYQIQDGRVIQWASWPALQTCGMLEPKQSRLAVVPCTHLHSFQQVGPLCQWQSLREGAEGGRGHIAQAGGGG